MSASEKALRLKEILEREGVNVLLIDMKGESESIMPHSAMAWAIGTENSIKKDRRWHFYAQAEDEDLLLHLIKQSKRYAARGDEKEARAMNLAIGNLIRVEDTGKKANVGEKGRGTRQKRR